MSPQRVRMIEDMILAGFAPGTQKLYVQAVRRLGDAQRQANRASWVWLDLWRGGFRHGRVLRNLSA
jgi:hypothetical protein